MCCPSEQPTNNTHIALSRKPSESSHFSKAAASHSKDLIRKGLIARLKRKIQDLEIIKAVKLRRNTITLNRTINTTIHKCIHCNNNSNVTKTYDYPVKSALERIQKET